MRLVLILLLLLFGCVKNERCNTRNDNIINFTIIITSFRRRKKQQQQQQQRAARETVYRWREKGCTPLCIYVLLLFFYFPFNIPLPDNAAAKDIPSVGRAFHDSHGVFRSLYPFLRNDFAYNVRTITGITPAPTLNPCIMQLARRR